MGSRVRVTAPQMSLERQVGQLLGLDSASLLLEGFDLGTVESPVRWVVPRGLLTELEVSHGVLRYADNGFLIGSAIGLGLGLASIRFGSACGDGWGDACALIVGGSTASFGFLGIVIGSVTRAERWISVSIAP